MSSPLISVSTKTLNQIYKKCKGIFEGTMLHIITMFLIQNSESLKEGIPVSGIFDVIKYRYSDMIAM